MDLGTCSKVLEIVQQSLNEWPKRNPQCLNQIDIAKQLALLEQGQLNSNQKLRLLVEFHRLPFRHVLTSIPEYTLMNLKVCIEKLEKQVFIPEIIQSELIHSSDWPFEMLSYCRDWLELRIRYLKDNKKLPNYTLKKVKKASRCVLYNILNDSKESGGMGLANRTSNRDTDFDKQMNIVYFLANNPVCKKLCKYAREHGSRFAPTPVKLWEISQLENDQQRMLLFHSRVEYQLDVACWFFLKCKNQSDVDNVVTWLATVLQQSRSRDKKPPRQWSTQQILSSMLPCLALFEFLHDDKV